MSFNGDNEDENKKPTDLDLQGRDENVIPFSNKNSLDEVKREKSEKAAEKLRLVRKVKELSGDSEWLITQQLLQEIHASYIIADPNKKLPPVKKLIEELKVLVKERFEHDEETCELLLQSIPSELSVREWLKKENWEEAVWTKLRASGLFSKEKRAAMIDTLWKRGVEGSDTAAKIWLTLSGDYSEKMDINSDKRVETFREVNELIHSKKNQN